jgi:hypothetical protein
MRTTFETERQQAPIVCSTGFDDAIAAGRLELKRAGSNGADVPGRLNRRTRQSRRFSHD